MAGRKIRNGKIIEKLRQKLGESLIETLAAMLIASLGLTLLPGAMVAAARVNAKAKAQELHLMEQKKDGKTSITDQQAGEITIAGSKATIHQVGDFYYYEASGKAWNTGQVSESTGSGD